MKLIYMTAAVAAMTLFASCDKKEEKKAKTLATYMDSVNYAFGIDIGNSLKENSIKDIDAELIRQGIAEVLDSAAKPTLSKEQAQQIVRGFFENLAKKQHDEELKKFESNKQEGITFLQENLKKAGVIAGPNGIQYEILKEGKGAKPGLMDKVTVHYHGTLINGKVFDSSVERGEPFTLGLNQVIPGWTEVLQLMPMGSKWKVYIPQELAYGDKPAGDIPPFSTLIFEIELLEIVKTPAQ